MPEKFDHTIYVNEYTINYSFIHHKYPPTFPYDYYDFYDMKKDFVVTTCIMECNGKIVREISCNNPKFDAYVKKIGNIISFHRASLSLFPDNKELRRKIFDEFWKKHGRRITKNKYASAKNK